jgi:hypothetical protein
VNNLWTPYINNKMYYRESWLRIEEFSSEISVRHCSEIKVNTDIEVIYDDVAYNIMSITALD